jgi:hypothetical protein
LEKETPDANREIWRFFPDEFWKSIFFQKLVTMKPKKDMFLAILKKESPTG